MFGLITIGNHPVVHIREIAWMLNESSYDVQLLRYSWLYLELVHLNHETSTANTVDAAQGLNGGDVKWKWNGVYGFLLLILCPKLQFIVEEPVVD